MKKIFIILLLACSCSVYAQNAKQLIGQTRYSVKSWNWVPFESSELMLVPTHAKFKIVDAIHAGSALRFVCVFGKDTLISPIQSVKAFLSGTSQRKK